MPTHKRVPCLMEGFPLYLEGHVMYTIHKDQKPFALGALAGAALIVWVGFGTFNWKTPGKAETLAKQQISAALTADHAQICLAQFNAGKDSPARMTKLQATDRWSRGDVIEKGGYATMAGAKQAGQGVSQACADLLIPDKA
jgi:hypothetical protein